MARYRDRSKLPSTASIAIRSRCRFSNGSSVKNTWRSGGSLERLFLFTQIVYVHRPTDLRDRLAQSQRRQRIERRVDAVKRRHVGHAEIIDGVPALLVQRVGPTDLIDSVVAHLCVAEVIYARAAGPVRVQPVNQLLYILTPIDI